MTARHLARFFDTTLWSSYDDNENVSSTCTTHVLVDRCLYSGFLFYIPQSIRQACDRGNLVLGGRRWLSIIWSCGLAMDTVWSTNRRDASQEILHSLDEFLDRKGFLVVRQVESWRCTRSPYAKAGRTLNKSHLHFTNIGQGLWKRKTRRSAMMPGGSTMIP